MALLGFSRSRIVAEEYGHSGCDRIFTSWSECQAAATSGDLILVYPEHVTAADVAQMRTEGIRVLVEGCGGLVDWREPKGD